ncbi:MAG: glycosyltransferase family 4 protein [Candidatus Woesearchaeota archaeon]|nr:glycosyltransferase family 4 protein [Candidatus Woesearchaeota archaeon]
MKIAIIYDMLYPYSIGGAEWRNFSLAKHLVLRGHEVHLFGTKMWAGESIKKVSDRFYIHGISSYNGKYFRGRRRIFEPIKFSIALFFELLKHDFDILDVSSFPYFPVFSAKAYSIIKKKPFVTTWHEFWGDYWKEYNRSIAPIGKIIEIICAKISKNNICVSRLTAENLKRYSKCTSIENWIESEEIDKAAPLKEKFDIISVGRHLKHKNFDRLLRGIAIIKRKKQDIRAMVIGEGPETLNLLKLRDLLGLEKNVEILSFCGDKMLLYRYMKSSKVFVLMSELEGFSITAFEAMACGLPVITLESRRNALKDYLPKENIIKNEIELASCYNKAKKSSIMFESASQVKKIEKFYRGLIK